MCFESRRHVVSASIQDRDFSSFGFDFRNFGDDGLELVFHGGNFLDFFVGAVGFHGGD